MTDSIYSSSTEQVRVAFRARRAGNLIDPTAMAVFMAFTGQTTPETPGDPPLPIQPDADDYVVATWETAGTTYNAMALVGPLGVVTLAPGTWSVFVKAEADPEEPVRFSGYIIVLP